MGKGEKPPIGGFGQATFGDCLALSQNKIWDGEGRTGLERKEEMLEGIRTEILYFTVGRVRRVLPFAPPPVPPQALP